MSALVRIVAARSCGYIRIAAVSYYRQQDELSSILPRFGLSSEPALDEIDAPAALLIVEALLRRDLAYNHEILAKDRAAEHAREFMSEFTEAEYRFFTNGDWIKYFSERTSLGWTPLTAATFDGGIIVVPRLERGVAACLWVEDED